MITFFLVFTLALSNADFFQGGAVDDKTVIDSVRKLSSFQLDPRLPKDQLSDWITKILGPNARIRWTVNDCGEQTGTPADQGRVFPMCVGIKATLPDDLRVNITIVVGNFQEGIKGKPAIYDIYVKHAKRSEFGRSLSNLPSMLEKVR